LTINDDASLYQQTYLYDKNSRYGKKARMKKGYPSNESLNPNLQWLSGVCIVIS
jgi:hypothetical protein